MIELTRGEAKKNGGPISGRSNRGSDINERCSLRGEKLEFDTLRVAVKPVELKED